MHTVHENIFMTFWRVIQNLRSKKYKAAREVSFGPASSARGWVDSVAFQKKIATSFHSFFASHFWDSKILSRFTFEAYWLAITPTRFYYSNYSIQALTMSQWTRRFLRSIQTLSQSTYMIDVFCCHFAFVTDTHITHSHTKTNKI